MEIFTTHTRQDMRVVCFQSNIHLYINFNHAFTWKQTAIAKEKRKTFRFITKKTLIGVKADHLRLIIVSTKTCS